MSDVKLIVISPEQNRSDEIDILVELFSAGLERYHVRKPHIDRAELARWIERVPAQWRSRLVLHQHHELVDAHGLGGKHWRDDGAGVMGGLGARSEVTEGGVLRRDDMPAGVTFDRGVKPLAQAASQIASRSCHDLATLREALGVYDLVFFGPVFPSLSKPGYGPKDVQVGEALGALLYTRNANERRTAVIAIGGITAATAPRARALGFDGVAVLGAVWLAADPRAAFLDLQRALREGSAPGATARAPMENATADVPSA